MSRHQQIRPSAAAAKRALRQFLLRSPRLFMRLFSPDDLELGQLGEEIAARHLARRGWKILARRLRTRSGEADLIARTRDALVVVEVKTGRSSALPRPRGRTLPEVLPDRFLHRLLPPSPPSGALLRWRPGARCNARRLARLRAVGRDIEVDPAFRPPSERRGLRPRVDLIEVWLSEPGRRFHVLHHEDLERPLP